MKLSIVQKDGSLKARGESAKPEIKLPVFKKPDLSRLRMPKVRLPQWHRKRNAAVAKSKGTDSTDLQYMKLQPKAKASAPAKPKLKSVSAAPAPAKPRQKSVPIGAGSVAPQFKGPDSTFSPKVQTDGDHYEKAAREVMADLKAGRVMRGSSGNPVTDKLSIRDLKYKAGGSPSREAIMGHLRSWGVVKSQGPKKAHIVQTAFRYVPPAGSDTDTGPRRDALDALKALGIKDGQRLVDATTGETGEEWARNAIKMHKTRA